MTNPSNPPAFPTHGSMGEVVQEGMLMRDYFASKIMSAMVYHHYNGANHKNRAVEWAQASYEIADAMLQERQKEGK